MIVFNRLYQHRRRLKMHMYQVAEQVGVDRQTYSKWEDGRSFPTVDYLFRLSRLFKVPINELYWCKYD